MTSISDIGLAFRGPVHRPGHDDYDALRRSWNRVVDPHPAVIAVATSPDDIAATVQFAARSGIPHTVQASGHGTHVTTDGGLLLRTHLMNAVAVDPARRVARVAAGATSNDVVTAAAAHGLAPLVGVGSVSVAGFTVGGGAGSLARSYGLAADSVVSADVVTADGVSRRISPESHPDLFWAVRGGGGSFAVVTSLEIRLYPVEQLWSGMRVYDIAAAPDALAALDAWAPTAPDATSVAAMLMTIPDDAPFPPPLLGRTVIGLRLTHVGGDADAALRPLTDPLGAPLVDTFGPTTLAETYASAAPHEPTGITQHFGFVDSLCDGVADQLLAVADTMVDPVETTSVTTMVEIRHWGGSLARAHRDSGATGALESPFSVLVAAQFDDASRRDIAISGVDDIAAGLRAHETGRTFLNFVSDPADVPRAFSTDAYARLTALKARWDPDGVIRPGIGIGGAA